MPDARAEDTSPPEAEAFEKWYFDHYGYGDTLEWMAGSYLLGATAAQYDAWTAATAAAQAEVERVTRERDEAIRQPPGAHGMWLEVNAILRAAHDALPPGFKVDAEHSLADRVRQLADAAKHGRHKIATEIVNCAADWGCENHTLAEWAEHARKRHIPNTVDDPSPRAPERETAAQERDTSLAARIHDSRSAYLRLEEELYETVEKIVGEDRLEDAHVECDSQYDNSVEIALADGAKLTDAERALLLSLGFSKVWNDKLSLRGRRDEPTTHAAARERVVERVVAVAKEVDRVWHDRDYRIAQDSPLARRLHDVVSALAALDQPKAEPSALEQALAFAECIAADLSQRIMPEPYRVSDLRALLAQARDEAALSAQRAKGAG